MGPPTESGSGSVWRIWVIAPRSAVVLQNSMGAICIAGEVGTADVNVDVSGHVGPYKAASVVGGVNSEIPRHDAIAQNQSVVIHVLQKQVECAHTLRESAF